MSEAVTLWRPSKHFVDESGLTQYVDWLQEHYNLTFDSYAELWKWSTDHLEIFWESLLRYFTVSYTGSYDTVVSSREMPNNTWFEGISLNYAEHLCRHQSDMRPALVFQNEVTRYEMSWKDMLAKASGLQEYLLSLGVGKGARVVGYLPNIPEAIIAFIAVNSIGAIWSCCSPDFGVDTVVERFDQIQPSVLIAVDGYRYNGKQHSRLTEVENIKSSIPTIKRVILIPYLREDIKTDDVTRWDTIEPSDDPLTFTKVPFDHPIWVLYSSGTTGKPKAITHSHGGVLLEHLKYMAFHNDVKEGERFFWFTTTGWMMWNFLQSSMLMGAIPVLFDGSPGYPSLNVLWRMADEVGIHHFGTSAPYLTACMKQDLAIGLSNKLESLRSIGSTGAPLPPEVFEWIYQHIKSNLWLCSMSGGTDVCTAFVGGNPWQPVVKGRIQSRALGCGLHAYDDRGQHVLGSLGEMVIEKPMPSMPIYFWNDENGERYHASYFEKYPGKWRHGDWINIYKDGSLIIHGRSDATLNRKGIRIGTAEIYNVLDQIEEIQDSLIINIERENGEDYMPLFVMLKDGVTLTPELRKIVSNELRKKCSPRHVPDEIIVVPDIPYTLSGKKMEVPVKSIVMKIKSPSSIQRDAIRNPEALDFFIGYAEKITNN